MSRFYEIDPINKTVNFNYEFNEDLNRDIKHLGYSVRFNKELKHWVVPVNDYSKERIKNFIRSNDFIQKVAKKQDDVVVNYEKNEVDYAYLKGLVAGQDFAFEPYKYQYECLGYILDKKRVINGDEVGLGKTFEAILYAETTSSFPCLVITPASVKYQWGEVWNKILKGKRSISVIESSDKNKDWNADVIIINYDIIGKKAGTGATYKFEELMTTEWKMAILDEIHFLKNSKSQRSKAAKKIIDNAVKKNDIPINGLTGTLTTSKPIDLWNPLKIIHMQDAIAPDWIKFVRRYCGGYKGKFGWVTDGATNTLELNKKLRENCYIARTKKDVGSEMLPVSTQIIRVPVTNESKYNRAVNNLIEYLEEEVSIEAAERAEEAEHLVQLTVLRKLGIEGKMKAIETYLKEWSETDERLVVFGLHKEELEYLAEKFKCSLITGNLSSKKKNEVKEAWIKSDEQFIFGNIESMGTGIDGFQHVASNILVLELPWLPKDIVQLIGRLYRNGQKYPVSVSYMLSNLSIDVEMWQMLEDKEVVVEAVNKGIDILRNKSGMKQVLSKIMKKKK